VPAPRARARAKARRWALAALVAGALGLGAGPARAFTISTLLTEGCHERITTEAFRSVRSSFATAAPLIATREERALIADLEFSPAPDMTDLGGATLLVGVRYNDLHGRDSNDLSQLALVHGDPGLQAEHCLHGSHDAEPGGTTAALDACRAFILGTISQALDGLDAMGNPDPSRRTTLPIWLSLRHQVEPPLPTFYLRVGQAVHAVEDIYSHTFRTPDQALATAAMNWIDEINDDLHPASDGPPHATELDRCDDPDDFRRTRRTLATQAAEAMLRTTLDPAMSREAKMAGVSALLDGWLGYSPGCSYANQWCDAPERTYGNVEILGCDLGGGARDAGFAAALALALAVLVARARGRAHARVMLAVALALTGALEARARAEPPTDEAAKTAAVANVPPPRTIPVPEPGPGDRARHAFGLFVGGAGSGTDAALAAMLGARVRATLHWTFGLDAEWNPWIAVNGTQRIRAGAFNGYGTAIFRVPLAYQQFNLRVTGSFGLSRTLIDLYGVPEGATGFFGALYPLGIEWKATRLFYVILNPLGVAAPVPQLRGIPFWYPQYRVSVGIELYAR
jgi:hypothetical protein